MELMVFLKGNLLALVLLTPDDTSTMQGYMNDHEVTQFLGRDALPMYAHQEKAWLESLPKEGHLVLGIWHRSDEKLIGSCGLHGIDYLNQLAELGILIGDKDYWNGGCGTEAVQLLCAHGFNWLNLRHITLRVLGNNPRGVRCYERCGFVRTGVIPGHVLKAGQWHDEIHMLLTKETLTLTRSSEMETKIAHMAENSR